MTELKPKKGFRIYRLVSPPDRTLPPATREANADAGLHPRGETWQVCVGEDFYDRDPLPADSERVPGKRYGYNWSAKRGYIEVTKDTPAWVAPPPPRTELPSWNFIRDFHFRGDGGAVEQVFQLVVSHSSQLAGVGYEYGDEYHELTDGLAAPKAWQNRHGHGGWARLRTAFAAMRGALA